MDIAHLKTFLEIYRLKHFGKASEKLYITQSAASARIKLLEERLGVKLFERKHTNLTPTLAGERLVKYAEAVVSNWEQARLDVGLPENIKRSVSISLIPDAWHFLLKCPLSLLVRDELDTTFHIHLEAQETIVERLIAGSVDMGIVFERIELEQLSCVELCTFQLQCYSTPIADMDKNSAANSGTPVQIILDWGRAVARTFAVNHLESTQSIMYVNSGLVALDILQKHVGSVYLPSNSALLQGSVLLPEGDKPTLPCQMYVLSRQQHYHQAYIQALINKLSTLSI